MESWKDIKDFPGYQVSDTGKVRSYVNNRHGFSEKPHELKPVYSKCGYPTVVLRRGNRRLVSRLVADAHIPNPDNLPFVRHMDDNPRNNNIDNLAWGTQKDNMQDCVRHKRLVGDTRAAIEARRIPIVAIPVDGGPHVVYSSMNEAARKLNLWPQHICNAVRGRIKQTGGYRFEYLDRGDKNE